MSTIQNGEYRSVTAGEDLSSSQYMFVTLESDGEIDLADAAADKCFGVLQNAPNTGQEASVKAYGQTKVVAKEALSIGDFVAPATDGKAQVAVAGQFARGVVVGAATAEDDLAVIELFYTADDLGGAETFTALTITDHVVIASDLITLTDGVNIPVGTTTGTEIGTAAAQKLGFHGATPVVQQSHVADPAAAASMTHTAGTGADGTTPSGAEYNLARDDLDALKTAVDANNAAIDSILATLETYGFHATS